MVVGVTGGSGSGKSTFAKMLQANLGERFCGILAQDRYYHDRHDHFDQDGGVVNFDHPDAVDFSLLIHNLKLLKSGQNVPVPCYDFRTHRRLLKEEIFPCRPLIVVEGILVLAERELRELFDFTFFIDTKEDLRFQRRLRRDVMERGRDEAGVRYQLEKHVKPMHELFVEPSRRFADRVVSGERSFGPIIEELIYGFDLEAWRMRST